jgi:hypothetical protein
VEHLVSNWLDDIAAFPKGSARFDSAFLMRDIAHEWHALPPLKPRQTEAA